MNFRIFAVMLCVIGVSACVSNTPAPVINRSQAPQAALPAPVSDSVKASTPIDRVARKGHYIVKQGDTLFRIALDHGQAYRDLAAWNGLEDPNRIEVGQELRVFPLDEDSVQPVAVTKPVGMGKEVEQRSLDGNSDAVKSQPKAGRDAYSEEALLRLSKAGETGVSRVELPSEPKVDAKPEVKLPVPPLKGNDEPQWAWPANGKLSGQFVEGVSKGLDILGKKGDPVLAASDGKVVYNGSGLRGYGQLLIIKHNSTYLTAYAHNSRVLVKEGQAVTRGQKIAEMGDTESDQVKLHFEVRRQGKPVDPLKHLPPR